MLIGLAIAMFIALFGWGANYFGWDDPAGKVQLALATSFILGIVRSPAFQMKREEAVVEAGSEKGKQ